MFYEAESLSFSPLSAATVHISRRRDFRGGHITSANGLHCGNGLIHKEHQRKACVNQQVKEVPAPQRKKDFIITLYIYHELYLHR